MAVPDKYQADVQAILDAHKRRPSAAATVHYREILRNLGRN